MRLADQLLPSEIWAATSAAARALLVAPRARGHELEAELGQNAANSPCPPSTDPPHAPPRWKAPARGRKRGGQPGQRGGHRALRPVKQVDEVVGVVSER
ncbi:MAG TPA: DUF6444 domain-containing protein [Chloroflexota bacterium]|nr:DUF6444 domain-containing protein [Chloroflexota bacterium]